MPGRYCNESWFETAIQKNLYQFLWDDKNLADRDNIQYRLSPGRYLEINNSWYVEGHPHQYFVNLNNFLDFIFTDYRPIRYALFRLEAATSLNAKE